MIQNSSEPSNEFPKLLSTEQPVEQLPTVEAMVDGVMKGDTGIIAKTKNKKERSGAVPPTALIFCPNGVVHPVVMSDDESFKDDPHKERSAAQVKRLCRRFGAWACLLICDAEYWAIDEDAHQLLGISKEKFSELSQDVGWLETVRDTISQRQNVLSFRLESHVGDWFGVVDYRIDSGEIVWGEIDDHNGVDRVHHDPVLQYLLPPPVAIGAA